MELVWRIALLVSAAAAFALGCRKILGKKTALFNKLILAGMGCLMLGRLFEVVTLLAYGALPGQFHIGKYAVMGGFMFFLSSSYGQMDGLVDDRSPALGKYRLIPAAAPALVLASGVLPLMMPAALIFRGSDLLPLLFIGAASYYSLKHLIIPDVSFGIIGSIRRYSLAVLTLAVLYAAQMFCETQRYGIGWAAASLLIIADCPLVIIALDKGVKKWTI